MKILLCSNVRLGAFSFENMSVELSNKWKKIMKDKFDDLFETAMQNNVSYIGLFGNIFGSKRVPESVIDYLFKTVSSEKHIKTFVFLNPDEYRRIKYRNDIPENMILMCIQLDESYSDEVISVSVNSNVTDFVFRDHESVQIKAEKNGLYLIKGFKEYKNILSFEPLGFEDAQASKTGYNIIEFNEDKETAYSEITDRRFQYLSIELKLLPEDDQKMILDKINKAIAKVDFYSFMRITLTGKTAFGITINEDALAEQLRKKIFYVEVFDNTLMDIDVEAFENDISLSSEFVRLALNDGSLSELERGRIISCGWNILNGRKVLDE